MVVGVLRLTLYIHGASSLKDKRQALRKVTDRVRARYNVSIAEVGDNDVWQRAIVGVCAVANDHSFVNEVLDKVVRDVEQTGAAEIVNREMEIETYSEMSADWSRLARPEEAPGPAAAGEAPAHADDVDEEAPSDEDLAWLREEDLP